LYYTIHFTIRYQENSVNFSKLHLDAWRFWLRSSLLLLAVALPLAFYLRTYDSAMVKITLLQLGVLTAAAIWALGSLWEGRVELPGESLGLLTPGLLLLLWNAVGFAFASHPEASLCGFIHQEACLLILILTAVSFSRRGLRLATMIILGGWLIAVLYGAAQHWGLDPFIWKGAYGEKVFSTFGNPNFFAAYLVLCAPLPLAVAADDSLPLWLRWACAVFAVISSLVLAWTQAFIDIGILTTILPVFLFRIWRTVRVQFRPAMLGLAGLCLAASLAAAVPVFSRKAVSNKKAFLVETWKGTWTMIKSHPWIGSGPGSFWVEYPKFRRPRIILIEHRHNNETDHPENELLEQWAEGGIVGVLLWLWLFGGLLHAGSKALSDPDMMVADASYGAGIFASVLGGVLVSLISVESRFPAPGGILFFAAGLLCAWCRRAPDQEGVVFALPIPGKTLRSLLCAIVLTATAGLVWGAVQMFQSDIHHNIAIYWSKAKEWDKAIQEYDKVVLGSPAYIMGQYFKGNVLHDRGGPGDLKQAVAQYRAVRTLAPDYVQVHHQEALALYKLGLTQEAIEQMEVQTRIDPTWDKSWNWLSKVYREINQPEKSAFAAQQEKAAKIAWEQ
jgi:O-antigen ligase